jgi:hypothetical protein
MEGRQYDELFRDKDCYVLNLIIRAKTNVFVYHFRELEKGQINAVRQAINSSCFYLLLVQNRSKQNLKFLLLNAVRSDKTG